jgi:hypothetical protein
VSQGGDRDHHHTSRGQHLYDQEDDGHVDFVDSKEEERYQLKLVVLFEHQEGVAYAERVEEVGRIIHAVSFSDRIAFAVRGFWRRVICL